MGYESWSPELQGSAQSRPIPLGPEHAGTMVRLSRGRPGFDSPSRSIFLVNFKSDNNNWRLLEGNEFIISLEAVTSELEH